MASQFIQYASTDVSGPGNITGQVGSLITVLDAILLNGYSGHAAAGWTRPVGTASNITSYKQGAGALLGIVINDNAPNATPGAREAWATGWESVAGVGSPVGSGSGQFPTPAQLLTSGHVVIRKSNTADGTGRAWIAFADSSTLYLFIAAGDVAGQYYFFAFGDVFSMKGATDSYRCLILGRGVENTSTATNEWGDTTVCTTGASPVSLAEVGHFMARTFGGGGTSITVNKNGDLACQTINTATTVIPLAGNLQTPNGADNSWYLSPVWITEASTGTRRGRMRGFYHLCHPITSFSDGQTFSGANDYAGKSFYIIKQGPNGGIFCIETSATVETN